MYDSGISPQAARVFDGGELTWVMRTSTCAEAEGDPVRTIRFSIAGLMGAVLFVAIGFAALRSASEAWSGALFLATRGVIGLALVGAICRRGPQRAWWLGFAVFGWIYMGSSFEPFYYWPKIPTQTLLEQLGARMFGTGKNMTLYSSGHDGRFLAIGHCLCTFLAAIFGAFLSRALFGAVGSNQDAKTSVAEAAGQAPARKRWLLPALVVLPGLVLVAATALAVPRVPPRIWAGLTFLLTWLFLGLVGLGCLYGRGKAREASLGAAVFGVGFMILSFGRFTHDPWPVRPIAQLLEEIRRVLPIAAINPAGDPSASSAENARIRSALEQKVRMQFVEETPLDDVLKYIQKETADIHGKQIPIYIDPLGLADRHADGPPIVSRIDFDGVPLRTSLRVCLDQCDLAYRVEHGLLWIIDAESDERTPLTTERDPFQIVGHCILALIAAVFGGTAAPLVCGLARRSSG